VHYNLLTTFDTFGNALKLTSKNRATSIFFDNSFSEQNPQKSFINRKQALVDDILMRKLPKSRPTIYSSNDFLEGSNLNQFFKQLKIIYQPI
jgi:hypothetical protein